MIDVCGASAQQSDRIYRIGWLWQGTPGYVQEPMEKWTGVNAVFRDAMQARGYVLGKNITVDARSTQGDVARLATEAESLVASGVDLIVAVGTSPTGAAIKATKRIPIVMLGVGSPVEKGFVASLANPGGNVTGMAVAIAGPKLWQLLRDIAPTTRRGGGLVYAPNNFANTNPAFRAERDTRLKADAGSVGIEFVDLSVNTLDEIDSKFAELGSGDPAGVVIYTDQILFAWRSSISAMALRYRLPTVCAQFAGWGQAGCLVAYEEDGSVLRRRVAAQVDKILKGAKPADIPVEQPTAFKLIINAKTAKALGLTAPPSLLTLADEVIE
jgi:putative tryptophan/tyrosine transport system substrate-binding protein